MCAYCALYVFILYVCILFTFVGAIGGGTASTGPSKVEVTRKRLVPLMGDTDGGLVLDGVDNNPSRNSSFAGTVAQDSMSVKQVVLPANADKVLHDYLSDNLTKQKGHDATARHLKIWQSFHDTFLGGSTDYWLEGCANDADRAKVWALFIQNLRAIQELKDKQITKILSGVAHQFTIHAKPTSFLDENLVKSMRKAIKPTTSEIRQNAIKNAVNVKLPMPTEVTDRMHEEGWANTEWNWCGTLMKAVSLGNDLSLTEAFRASNVVTPGKGEEDHAVRYSDIVFAVVDGTVTRRVTVCPALVDIAETSVVSVVSHVYSTKTGAVLGPKIPYTITREADVGNRLVTKMFLWAQRMVQSPLFNIDDHLCTVYRQDTNQKWHRRCTRRSDLTAHIKDHAEALGIPRQHASHSSLRKTAATDTRLRGGDDHAVAQTGRWAQDKHGRSAVASVHYDVSAVTGRAGTRGGQGLSVQEVLNMVPLHTTGVPEKTLTNNTTREHVKSQSKRKATKSQSKRKVTTKKTAPAVSPKHYNKKR